MIKRLNLTNITIGKRIGGMVAFFVLIALVLSFTSMRGLSNINRGMKDLQSAGAMDEASMELKIQVLEARRAEKDFLLRKDLKYVERNKEAVQKVLAEADKASEQITTTEGKSLVEEIKSHVAEYDKLFNQMVALEVERGLDEKSGLRGSFRNLVHSVEDALKKRGADDSLMVSLLMIRRHEKDYMIRGASKYVDKLHNKVAGIKGQISQSTLDPGVKVELNGLWDQYKQGFDALVGVDNKIKESTAQFRNTVHAIEPLAQKLESMGMARQEHDDKAMHTTMSSTNRVSAVVSVLSVVFSIVIGFLMARSVVKPINLATYRMKDIAEGEGDLTQRLDDSGSDELAQMSGAFNKFVDKIEGIIQEVAQAAIEMSQAAEEVSVANQDLSQRTSQQAASLEETAASMQEMTASVKQNADNAANANSLSAQASAKAEEGGQAVSRGVEAMEGIKHSSGKISDIITVIDGIAFQTNLLALNAAVEAARAGEQGRGFAVVAGEVRELAQRSAAAAKEIKELIEDSVSKVDNGSQMVEQSGKALEEIVIQVSQLAEAMSEIAAASQEQSSGIEQVDQAVNQMDEVTQQNSAAVEEMAAASEQLAAQCRGLREMVSFFKTSGNGKGRAASASPTAKAPKKVESVVKRQISPKEDVLALAGALESKPGNNKEELFNLSEM